MDFVRGIRIKDILYEVYSRKKSIKYTIDFSTITEYEFPCIIDHVESLKIYGNTKGKINDIPFECSSEFIIFDLPKNTKVICDKPCNIIFTGITNYKKSFSRS